MIYISVDRTEHFCHDMYVYAERVVYVKSYYDCEWDGVGDYLRVKAAVFSTELIQELFKGVHK